MARLPDDLIECKWHHKDCVNEEQRELKYCKVLINCDFPKRLKCPFYKPRKEKEK